jgi:membrane protease YdiL (CAAX protease family)
MKNFIENRPFWFALSLTVVMTILGLAVFIVGGELIGLPEIPLVFTVLLLSTVIPLGFIGWLGWWEDAGFVTTTQNVLALTVPVIGIFFPLIYFGTVENGPQIVIFFIAAFFLTGLSEEALSRGLFVRVFLPHGRWQAVLIPAVLFGVGHIAQSLGPEMALQDNLVQIANALISGILVGAVRLRVNNIWPLIILHTLEDLFFGLSGFAGPNAIYGLADIPLSFFLILWVLSLGAAVYIMNRPLAATIDGKPVG